LGVCPVLATLPLSSPFFSVDCGARRDVASPVQQLFHVVSTSFRWAFTTSLPTSLSLVQTSLFGLEFWSAVRQQLFLRLRSNRGWSESYVGAFEARAIPTSVDLVLAALRFFLVLLFSPPAPLFLECFFNEA